MSITATQDIAWPVLGLAALSGTQDLAWSVAQVGAMAGTADIRWSVDAFQARISGSELLQWAVGVEPGTTIQVVLDGAPTGRVGILTVSIVTLDGGITVYFPTTQGIEEVPAGTGRYVATVPRPDVGEYFVVWSDGQTTTEVELDVVFASTNPTRLRVLRAPVQPVDDGELMEFAVSIDSAGVPVDPETLTLRISPPVGTDVIYTYGVDDVIFRDGVGQYRAVVPMFAAGSAIPSDMTSPLGAWRWEAAGDYQDAEDGRYFARRSLALN